MSFEEFLQTSDPAVAGEQSYEHEAHRLLSDPNAREVIFGDADSTMYELPLTILVAFIVGAAARCLIHASRRDTSVSRWTQFGSRKARLLIVISGGWIFLSLSVLLFLSDAHPDLKVIGFVLLPIVALLGAAASRSYVQKGDPH